MITVNDISMTAIGEAIYHLSKEASYNGKIDLILPDVTKIVDYEFQNAHALNSINLPKVNTIGVKGIDSCFYLQELTFGSVVTSIKDSSGTAFVDVGKSVDGGLCDLVLSCGQAIAPTESEYQPNLSQWWGITWKSITLAHSGGEATGICSSCGAVRITGYALDIDGYAFGENAAFGTATGWTDPTRLFNLNFNWGANSQVYAELWDATKKLLSETVIAQPDETNDNYMQFSFAGSFVGTPTNVLAAYGIGADLTATMPNEFTQSTTSDPSFLNDHILLQGSGAYGEQVNFTHIPALFCFKITNKRDTLTTIDSVSIRLVDEAGENCPIASSGVTLTASAAGWTTAFSGGHDKITTTINAEVAANDWYRAYAAALPLPGTDPLKGKTMQFVLNLEDPTGESEYESVVYEIDAESIAAMNDGSYNWVGGEMLEFEIMTDQVDISSVTVTPFVEKELDSVCAVKDSTDTSDFAAAAPAPTSTIDGNNYLYDCSIGVTTTNAINTNSAYNVTNNEWVNDDTGSLAFDTSNAQAWGYGSTLTAYAPYSQDYSSITYDLANNGNYLLYGKSDTVTGSYSDLTLEHKLASLYVSGLTGTTLQNVELSGIYTTATFDGSTGTLTPTGNKGAIGIDVDRKEILLIPMEEGEVTLRIRLSDGSVYTTKMNLALEAGTYYNLPVQLGHTGTLSYQDNGDGTHTASWSCCGETTTEAHSGGSYSVSGEVITDSCTKCGTELGTATISATGKTYDGSAVEANVTKTGSLAEKTIAVTYAVKGGATLEGAPANAGTYTASITMGEGENAVTVSVEFTIVRKPVTATVTAQDKTYDGNTTATVTATVDSADLVSGDSITITGLTGTFSDANVGENKTVTIDSSSASVTGINAGCYEISYPNTTATISPKEVTNPTITLEKTSYEYTGKAIQPAVTVKDGDTTLTAGTDYDVSYGENKNAGTGTVTVALKGNCSGSKTVEFAISKVTLTVTADNKTMTTGYALPAFTYTITGFVNDETESVLTTKPVAQTSTDGKTAGTFDITVSGAAADNYDFTYVKGTLTVVDHQHNWTYTAKDGTITAKCGNADTCPDAEQSITLNASDAVYSGNPVNAAVTRDGTDLTYTLHYTGTDGYDSSDAPTNAGTYTVTMTVGDKSVSDTFTISPKDIVNCTASLAKDSFTYSGTAPELTVTVVDNGVGSYTMVEGTDYTVGTVAVNAGSHKLTVTGTGNYTGTVELDYTITAKAITPTVEGVNASYSYTGKAIQPTVTVKDGNTALAAGTDYDVTYDSNTNVADGGSVTVTLKGNYSGSKTADFAISKVTLTVTADNKTMTTGHDLPDLTYTITGFVNGETEEVLTTKPVAQTSANGQTAGTFDITVSGAAAANYDFNYVKGTLSVVDHQHDWTYTAKDGTITAILITFKGNYSGETTLTYEIVAQIPTIIVKQPTDQFVVEGQRAEFSIEATGAGLTYQWYINRNDGRGWRDIEGAIGAVYITSVTDLECDGFQYGCLITDQYGNTLKSDVAVLHVSKVPVLPETGDSSTPMLWLAMSILSMAGILLLRKKAFCR